MRPVARPVAAGSSYVRSPSPLFEYVGRTGLTVIGPGSGRRYRFEHFGHRILVDDADRQSLAALPQLRLVVGTRPR